MDKQYTWDLEPFVERAMQIAERNGLPTAHEKQDFANLISAVYIYAKEQMKANNILPKEMNTPHQERSRSVTS